MSLANGGHGAALLFPRGSDPALKIDHFPPCVGKVGLRNDVLGRQRLEHSVDLALSEREAALQSC